MKALLALLAAQGVGLLVFFWFKKEEAVALWEVGDVLNCHAAGDPGQFTIIGRRKNGVWSYHMGEGPPPIIEDLGWWTEQQLLELPWLCHIS